MHVALTADPYLPVPPRLYGGIERVVDLLARELERRGHRVTLFAHPDSQTAGVLHPYGVPPHSGFFARLRELSQVGAGLVSLRDSIDVVHSFGRLAALLPILPMRHLPKVQSYQREVPWTGVRRAAALAGGSLVFTGCSTAMYASKRTAAGRGEWRTIFNMVDASRYTAVDAVSSDAPLVFLGRLERIKGPHHAIAIANRAGRRLIIAGNIVREGPDHDFFDREIRPHVDDDRVRYVGPVTDEQKDAILGQAAALLMPVEWDEPFGIVMAEALACGTPVIGLRRGSVPEVVRDGINGFVCDTLDGAVDAVHGLARLDRRAVRRDCEARFDVAVVTTQYEDLYAEIIDRLTPVRRDTGLVRT